MHNIKTSVFRTRERGPKAACIYRMSGDGQRARIPLMAAVMAITFVASLPAQCQTPPTPIHGAHFPALSPDGSKICFSYLGDLWTSSTSSGGAATRITLHQAYDGYPRWSPDGNWIAFSSNREGNFDVFLVPARGGEARQLTYHSADDYVCDWSPDGSQILFQSAREGRYSDLYTINVKDGSLRRITNDKTLSRYGSFSPDGKTIAYVRGRQEWWRPKYKGSANTEIYTIPARGGKATRWTTYDGVDSFPLWSRDGKSLYFVTDRDGGRANLYRVDAPGAKPLPITAHTADSVHFPTMSADGTRIAYECDFQIFTLPMNPGSYSAAARSATRTVALNAASKAAVPTPLNLYAPSDTLTNLADRVTFNTGIASLSLTEDGKSVAFAARGEIWTLAADGGDATRITKNGSAEYGPAWSPDGTKLVYTTDRNGNLDVCMYDVAAKKETVLTSDSSDETNPQFASNGQLVAYVRTGGSTPGLYVLPLPKDGAPKSSDAVLVGAGAGVGSYDWSPDARWLVYSKRDSTGTSDLWIVPSVGGTPVNVTRYPGGNTNPQWSRDGRHIVFMSSRNNAPGQFAMNIYEITLVPRPQQEDVPEGAPLGRRRGGAGDEGDSEEPGAQGRRRPPTGGQAAPAIPQQIQPGMGLPFAMVPPRSQNVVIEFDDIQNRARPLTNTRDGLSGVTLSPDSRSVIYAQSFGGQVDWWAVNLLTGQSNRITAGSDIGGSLEFTGDASKAYFVGGGGIRMLMRGQPAAVPVSFNATMVVDRRVEVAEAFNEAWRTLRTRFYDPKFHGVDWLAVRKRFEPLLTETASKEDFAFLLQQMIGELNASHMGATPPASANPTTTAYLGLGFDQDYSGPGLRVNDVMPKGPSDQLGKRVANGDYVVSIDGEDVTWNENLFKTLTDKAGKTVDLLVNNKPSKEGARSIKVRAVTKAALDDLEYERWVEERKRKVDALSGGQLAYIHIRGMDQPSLQRFQREIFGDAQSKKGLVLDVRFNGGGRIHDELFSYLTRKAHVYETPRDAGRSTQPFQLWERPIILLINEFSASDAEIFPNGFRFYGLGKIVGVPTYGGVIGTNDITLVDGTRFRIPTTGWTTVDGRNLENWGVPPDIRVEMSPEDYAKDDDKQLETAVKAILEQMTAKR